MFTFEKLHKVWRKGKPPSSLNVYTFQEDTKLCVVATLEKYLKRTKVWRVKDKCQLLLSFIKPHNLVVSSIVSRWIKNVLRETGIDNGLSVRDILERGSSSNDSAWQRFHNRQVDSSAGKYQNKVLS